jgi:hypothetical protein
MSNRVFILGAGFSKAAGFPLANELVYFIQNHLNTSMNARDIEFKKEFSDFLNGIHSSLFLNVELFLTYIDLALLNNSVGIFTRSASAEDLRLFRRKLSGALVRTFDNAHFELTRGFSNRNIFLKFCEQLQDGDSVITFNYDLVVEQGLWLQRKWTFLDGYGFEKDINDFQAQFGGTYPADIPTKSLIKVYKLHGSLGWIYDDLSGQIIYIGMPNYFQDGRLLFCEKNLQAAGAKWDEGTTLIEPSYIKQFNCTPILDIWEKAFKIVQQCSELIIIGYSLPVADSAAQAFLSSGIRSSQITSITIVDLSPTVFNKFEILFKRKVDKKKMTFREWIENETRSNRLLV